MGITVAHTKTYASPADTGTHTIGTWGFTPAVGDLMVAAIVANRTFNAPTSTTDRLLPPVDFVQVSIVDWIYASGSSFDVVTGGGNSSCCVRLFHVTSNASSPYDTRGANGGKNSTSTAPSTDTTPTLAQAAELAIVAWGCSVDGSFTTGTETNSFATNESLLASTGGCKLATSYKVVAATTALESTITTSNEHYSAGIVTYKEATTVTTYVFGGQFDTRDL